MLQMEIIQERLSREFDLDLNTTAPSVVDKLELSRSTTEDALRMELHRLDDAFRGSADNDIFKFVGGKGSGVWGLHRARALAWMAATGRVCDFRKA